MLCVCVSSVVLQLLLCIPVGHVTYTHSWHPVMSLHVRKHPDSQRKITSVSGGEMLPLSEVLDFLAWYLQKVGDFSCGQHSCIIPAVCPHAQTSNLSQCFPGCYCSSPLPLFFGYFLPLYRIPSISIPAFILHLSCPALLSGLLSLHCQGANARLQMRQLDFPEINKCCSLSGRTLLLQCAHKG